jgi:hypothetical protein
MAGPTIKLGLHAHGPLAVPHVGRGTAILDTGANTSVTAVPMGQLPAMHTASGGTVTFTGPRPRSHDLPLDVLAVYGLDVLKASTLDMCPFSDGMRWSLGDPSPPPAWTRVPTRFRTHLEVQVLVDGLEQWWVLDTGAAASAVHVEQPQCAHPHTLLVHPARKVPSCPVTTTVTFGGIQRRVKVLRRRLNSPLQGLLGMDLLLGTKLHMYSAADGDWVVHVGGC